MHTFPILLVDDQPSVADRIEQAAKISFPEARFIQVDNFEAAKEYLLNLTGRDPKIALISIESTEGLDGLAFLRFLQGHPQGRLLPVIVLSTAEVELLVTQVYQMGASAFTQKPASYEEWKNYLQLVRRYWYETATLPSVNYCSMGIV